MQSCEVGCDISHSEITEIGQDTGHSNICNHRQLIKIIYRQLPWKYQSSLQIALISVQQNRTLTIVGSIGG